MKGVISSFTPRILAEAVPGKLNLTSNLDISHSSSSSQDTVGSIPIPISPKFDYNIPPPPPYEPSALSKEEPCYRTDNDRISNSSLENYAGDQEINKNSEPLWYHANDTS